jgi:hypothetical protein
LNVSLNCRLVGGTGVYRSRRGLSADGTVFALAIKDKPTSCGKD